MLTSSDLREQDRRARDFAYHLGQVWDRRYGAPSSVSVLDALVLSGLVLEQDERGVATAALFTAHPARQPGEPVAA